MKRVEPKRPPRGVAAPPRPRPARATPFVARRRREARLKRLALGAGLLALVAVVIVPLIGFYREVLTKGSQPVAHVNGEVITLDTFTRLYGFRLTSLEGQLAQMQQLGAQMGSQTQPGAANPFQQQIQRLQSQRDALDTTVLNELIEQNLIAREAAARGVTVSREDEDAQIVKEFTPPTPAPTPTPQPGEAAAVGSPTATDGSPTPEIAPTPTADPFGRMRSGLDNMKTLNEEQYRQLVVRPQLLSERLQDTFANEVPATEVQIHARHILVRTEEEALKAKERLANGESFETVAAEMSTDTSNKDKGGDLGWFGPGKMTKAFEEAAMALPVNQISDPVKTSFGFHIIQVLERDENRPIDPERRVELRNERFKAWLEKQKDDGFQSGSIGYDYGPDKLDWARKQIGKTRGFPVQP